MLRRTALALRPRGGNGAADASASASVPQNELPSNAFAPAFVPFDSTVPDVPVAPVRPVDSPVRIIPEQTPRSTLRVLPRPAYPGENMQANDEDDGQRDGQQGDAHDGPDTSMDIDLFAAVVKRDSFD